MNVIVLEDDSTHLGIIKNLLETAEADFKVFAFMTYNEAWEQFEEFKKEKEKLDLLIVDIRLNLDQMEYGGLTFAANVRKYRPVPTVIISNHFNFSEYEQKVRELELPTRFYFPKSFLDHEGMLLEQVWAAIFDFQRREWTAAEYLLQASRKIGLLDAKGKYQFFGKDDIIYLTSDEKSTVVHMTGKRKTIISSNIGHIGPLIQYNYPNICKMGIGYWVNLEKIISFDMRNMDDFQRRPELELEEDHKIRLLKKDFQILFSDGLLIQPKTRY